MSSSPTAAPSPDALDARVALGCRNLLEQCMGLSAGEKVLLICEDAALDHFDPQVAECVGAQAEGMGAQVFYLKTPRVKGPEDFPEVITGAMERADHTVFFSRIGDQLRFDALPGAGTKTMTYVLDRDALASDFAGLPHELMLRLRQKLHEIMDGGVDWRVTCPLGTDVSGHEAAKPPSEEKSSKQDFSLRLFPVTITRPLAGGSMNGRVALSRWITSTDTHLHDPDLVRFEGTVFANVAEGRITGFDGPPEAVRAIQGYYDMVSRDLNLDPAIVHSWHAGIHPKTYYNRPAADHPSRWGSVAYASPRHVHFHTCGDYAPGEIAWTVIDPTITYNGEVLWDGGRFTFLERPDVKAIIADYPGWDKAYEVRQDLGI